MADNLRIRSGLPLAINATEPLPEEFKDKPGLAPKLRSVLILPGLNEFSGTDAEVYGLWAKGNPTFVADADAVKAGATDGLVYEVQGDEDGEEYGFQPALDRAGKGAEADAASNGSTVTGPGPLKADDMAQKPDPAAPVTPVAGQPAVGAKAAAPAVPAAAPAK